MFVKTRGRVETLSVKENCNDVLPNIIILSTKSGGGKGAMDNP